METLEPESWERGGLTWTARRLQTVRSFVRSVLLWLGIFWLALAALLASLYFPEVRLFLLFTTAAIAALIGVWFISWAIRISLRLGRYVKQLHEMSEMSNVERHAFVERKFRRKKAKRVAKGPTRIK